MGPSCPSCSSSPFLQPASSRHSSTCNFWHFHMGFTVQTGRLSERCCTSKLRLQSASMCPAQSRKAKTLFWHGLPWPIKASTSFILGSSYFHIDINHYQIQCQAHGAGVVLSVEDFSKLEVGGGWSEAELTPDEIHG